MIPAAEAVEEPLCQDAVQLFVGEVGSGGGQRLRRWPPPRRARRRRARPRVRDAEGAPKGRSRLALRGETERQRTPEETVAKHPPTCL